MIDSAFLKLTAADDLIEEQSNRVDIEDRTRSNAATHLSNQTQRLGEIKALAEVHNIESPTCTQAIRNAEHALDTVSNTIGSGAIPAAMRVLESATLKVEH